MPDVFQHVNPVDVIANVATGGLYGVGKGVAADRPLQALASAGPFGAVAQPTIGTGPTLAAEAAGAGAGFAGGGLGGGGFGTAGEAGAGATAGGFGTTGALLGGSLAYQAANLLSQLTAPRGPGLPPLPTGPSALTGPQAQGLTPQQLAALSALASEPHKGLAPRFAQRIAGMQEDPGLAGDLQALRMAA